MKKLRSAIIGCGNIHLFHADAIKDHPQAELAAVVDIDPDRARKTAERFTCEAYSDYRQVLNRNDIDVIHLCTPHYLHAPMAIEAMQQGKHVLTEKPMAITVEEAERMNAVSRETGKVIGVCFQNRYNPTSVHIRELLDSGKAGQVKGGRAFVTWNRDAAYYRSGAWRGKWSTEGGGVIINQAIHTLDLMQWFLGGIAEVKGHVGNRSLEQVIEVEDTVEAFFTTVQGVRGLFYASNAFTADSPVFLELVCEHATLTLNGALTVCYKDGTRETVSDEGLAVPGKNAWGTGHMRLIHDFYDKLISHQPFPIDGIEGIKAIRILRAVYQASVSGKGMVIDPEL